MEDIKPMLCEFHNIPLQFNHVEVFENCVVGMYECPICIEQYEQNLVPYSERYSLN